jgi:hypothetical protein
LEHTTAVMDDAACIWIAARQIYEGDTETLKRLIQRLVS